MPEGYGLTWGHDNVGAEPLANFRMRPPPVRREDGVGRDALRLAGVEFARESQAPVIKLRDDQEIPEL